MRIAIFLLAIVGIFVTAFFAGREGWLRSGDDEKHADRNPFQFTWESRGEGGRWMLAVEPGQFESFLLVKRLSPAFEGLSPPMVISSSDDRVFASAVFDEVVGISTATVSSYARLAEDRRPVGRRALRFPLGGVRRGGAGRRPGRGRQPAYPCRCRGYDPCRGPEGG